MKMRNILIALVVIAAGLSGAVSMFSRPADNSAGKSLVTHRPLGVAYAQEGGGSPPPPPGDPGAAPPAGEAAAPAASTSAPATELTDEEWLAKLEEWKNSDPRDIIKAKYDDLESRETDPSDEDNPEQFIPETGRVDPLTPVSGAIPDELKPPRSGETDINEAENYLYSSAATEAVDIVGALSEVHNVLQIGLTKIVSMSLGDERFTLQEGQGFSTWLATSYEIPVQVSFNLASASTDEVVISVSGTPWNSTVTITKNFNYIPR